ncbi:PspA/IM30 family protein [Paenibacillus sp. J22TS3]|uniref:PspA/IM30 family protein n=1 Tax=Paenibacillus sp. J22TS3 TaxID=2807192 RepID=UPI001B24DE39|nr:hypothetical protein [Paenibacillus sp. J22TS3]GIP23611.1 hypothetical protein J22TS3_38860 [Paenibacillus sp. J22TS3]
MEVFRHLKGLFSNQKSEDSPEEMSLRYIEAVQEQLRELDIHVSRWESELLTLTERQKRLALERGLARQQAELAVQQDNLELARRLLGEAHESERRIQEAAEEAVSLKGRLDGLKARYARANQELRAAKEKRDELISRSRAALTQLNTNRTMSEDRDFVTAVDRIKDRAIWAEAEREAKMGRQSTIDEEIELMLKNKEKEESKEEGKEQK